MDIRLWIFILVMALTWGTYPIFGEKATNTHGPHMNFVLDWVWMGVISLGVAIYKFNDFSRITSTSLLYSIGLSLSSVGFLFYLISWDMYGLAKVPIIMGLANSLALIVTVFVVRVISGAEIEPQHWICIILTALAIFFGNLSKENMNQLFGLFGLNAG